MSAFSRKFRLKRIIKHNTIPLRLFATTSQVADTQIDNSKAIKLIKYLYVNNRKKGPDTYKTIEQGLEIYNKITETPTPETINNILRLFQSFGHPNEYITIWNDIESLEAQEQSVSYPLLIKCCIDSDTIDIQDCLQVLQWMKDSNYTLKIKESYISKLVQFCGKRFDTESIDFIYDLLIEGYIECDSTFIKTTFINTYSRCNELDKSIKIFDAIDIASEMNMICYGSMMKCFINHGFYAKTLEFYDNLLRLEGDNKDLFQNDHCNSMALQACIKSDNFAKGKAIHDRVNKKLYDKGKRELEMNPHVKHSLISFYGHFDDLQEAKRLFSGIRNNHANMIALNSMMTVYIKHGKDEDALTLYEQALEMNDLSHTVAIRSCINTKKNRVLFYQKLLIGLV